MATTTPTSSSSHWHRIEPLTRDNWPNWRQKVEWVLSELDMYDHVTVPRPRPVPIEGVTITADITAAQREWDRRDEKVRREIGMRIGDEFMVYARGERTAASLWARLTSIFESSEAINVLTIRREFFRTQAEEGVDIEEHTRKLRQMYLSLMSRGVEIPDRDFCNVLLTSLPPTLMWKNFMSSTFNNYPDITSESLISKIIDQDRLMNNIVGRETALINASRATKGRSKKATAVKGKCRNCGKKGHWEKDCWAPGGGKEGQAPKNWKPKQKEQVAKSTVPNYPPKMNEDYAFMSGETNETAYVISSSDWLADSAASTHIARERTLFHNYQSAPSEIEGVVAGTMLKVQGHGSVFLNFQVGKKNYKILLNDVKHAPDASSNLLSIRRITAAGYTLSMDGSGVKVRSKNGTIIAEGIRTGYMFKMIMSADQSMLQSFTSRIKARTWDKWHRILGHMGIGAVKKLKTSKMVNGMEVDETKTPTQCPACIQGKQHVEPFPKQAAIDQSIEVGDVVVSDVWGPATFAGMSRQRYYISFTDLKSRYSIVYFSEHKSMTLDFFKLYKAFIKRQLNKEVKRIRTDNGREYVNREFQEYCGKNGIIMETTAPYSPAQNGITERLNRTLVENARAMIFAKNLPKSIWPEAVNYACYIKNRSPVRALENMTPYEALLGRKPDIERLEEFGTRCWVMVPDERRTKLEPKAECHVFIGINEYSKSWRY
ncbi:MAG TPA: DDE-type integrase/transposase/recombinase [Chlamydiales bacterium]|nr:DDE-type integrase/transposase/recombinase [Chlamydiales bacterium]